MARFKLVFAAAILVALVAAGIAVADKRHGSAARPVVAHFTATSSNVRTRTCTAGTQTVMTTRATFNGTSTSTEPSLNGPARITVQTTVNTANGFGVATGKFRVRSSTSGKTQAALMAVVSGSTRLDGFLRGDVENSGQRSLASRRHDEENDNALFANFSATIAGNTLTGDLGGGTHDNTAVIAGRRCDEGDH